MSSLVVATNREDQVAPIQLALPKDVARRCHARRLPVELWDIIFEDCVPGAPEPNLAAAPLNVSQVCRSWRDISLSNSVLWSILAINTSCRHMEGSHALGPLCDLIQLWLGRSVTRLLSVSLAQSGEDKSTSFLPSLLKMVLAHAKNLRGLEVRAPATCLGPLGSPALYLPELEHLKIESPGPELISSAVVLPLDRAPRLRNLAALDISFDAAHISVFDYRQLTELTLLPDVKAPASVFLTADEALYFLFDAPKLRNLRLAVMDREPRRKTVSQADALHSLSLYFHDARTYMPRRHERIGTFFSLLCTPNLQHLLVKDCGEDDPGFSWPADYLLRLDSWPQKRFAAYLSATQMRTLTLVYIPLYQSQVADCVQRMPQLRELFIEARPHRGSQCNVGDFLLMVLTPSNMALRAVAPALHSIEFRNCGRRCTEQGLLEMIDARHALQYVRLQRTELPTKELAGRVTSWNPNVCECGCARQMGYSVVLDCGRK